MQIQEAFQQVSTFEELSNIAEKAELKLSFWGRTYFTVKGYSGYLQGLDIFTIHLTNLLEQKNFEFSERERAFGKKIRKKIDFIYEQDYWLYKNSHFITKKFKEIRDRYESLLVYMGYIKGNIDLLLRDEWFNECKSMVFELYNKNQYIQTFGYDPEIKFKYNFPRFGYDNSGLDEEHKKCWLAPNKHIQLERSAYKNDPQLLTPEEGLLEKLTSY